MPFAVVGSNITLTDPETGHRYRGREYPWGCVNIEDKVGAGILVGYPDMVGAAADHRSLFCIHCITQHSPHILITLTG